jgi:TonB-dependent SusC/RagA subfamily outer membrane receptor
MLPHPKIIGVGINAKPDATIIVTEKDSDSSLSFKTENNTIAVLGNTYLIILNGKEVNKAILDKISPTDIKSVNILKDNEATLKYGDKGKNGVVIIETTLKEADL